MSDHSKIIAGFEQQGEPAIRKWLSEHVEETSGRVHYRLAQQWVSSKDSERRDAREEEILSIARKALSNSNRANIIAIIATIIAAIAIILGKS